MIAVLAAAAVGLLSAFLPFTPAEPYLIAAVTTTAASPPALGIAAAAGQTAGKTLLFLGARGAIRSGWLQRRLTRRPPPVSRRPDEQPAMAARLRAAGARLVAALDRPGLAAGVLLLSAVTGVPPLLAVSVYLGRTPMRVATFAVTCLLGRAIRFTAIALAPQLAGF
jgi:membrane protein YqaA with SNARE-associated domain